MVFVRRAGRIADDDQRLLDGASGVSATFIDGKPFVLVTAAYDRAVTVLSMAADGALTQTHNLKDASSRALRGAGDSEFTVLADGKTFLVITTPDENAVGYYEVRSTGFVFHESTFFDDVVLDPPDESDAVRDGGDQSALFGAKAVATFEQGDQNFVVVAARNDAGLTLLEMTKGGKGAVISTFFDTDDTPLQGVEGLATAEFGDTRYFITAAALERGLSVFQIDADNQFVNVSNFHTQPELPLARLTTVETVSIGENVFVLAGGFGPRPLTVFQLSAEGQLTPLSQFRDAATENLTRLSALQTFELDGKTYVAMGGDTGGVNLYRMKANGALNLVTEFDHARPAQTNPVTDFDVITISGKTYLIATGQQNDGVATYRVFGDARGKTLTGDGGRDVLKGGSKGDILIGDGGNDRLKGKSGKDLLLDGDGKDQLFGGSGRDIFEFAPDGLQDRVQDFQDGLDLIDLSASVSGFDDITMTQLNQRVVRLTYDEEVLLVRGFGKLNLSVDDLTADDFILG